MSSKKKAAAIKQQEDTALTRALVWFAAAMVIELLLLLVNNIFTRGIPSWNFANDLANAMPVIAVGCLVCAAAAGFWCRKSSAAKKELAFLPLVLSVVFVVLAGSAVLLRISLSALDLLKVAVPGLGVLALVYYLYQKEFFLSALCSGVTLLGLWVVKRGSTRVPFAAGLCIAAGIVVLAAVLVLAILLKKKNGVLTIRGKRVALFGKQTNYLPVFLSCALGVLALCACLVLGEAAAFYLLFALLAWLLLLLVYYTVKLM